MGVSMSEIQEATQIVAVTMQAGTSLLAFAFRLFKASAIISAKTLNTLYLAKWRGKTSFQRFRNIKGDDMQFMCIHSENSRELRQIFQEMKKHGILTGRLPDLCKGDGMTQFVVAPSDMVKVEAFLKNHSRGKNNRIKIEPISAIKYKDTGYDKDGNQTKELEDLEKSAKEQVQAQTGTDLNILKEIKTPDIAKVTVDQESLLFRHSRVSAYKLPDSPFAVMIPNVNTERTPNGKIDLFINLESNYTSIDKKSGKARSIYGSKVLEELHKRPLSDKKMELLASNKKKIPELAEVAVAQNAKLFHHSRISAYALPDSPYAAIVPNQAVTELKDGRAKMYLDLDKTYTLIHKQNQTLISVSGRKLAMDFAVPSLEIRQGKLINRLEKNTKAMDENSVSITISKKLVSEENSKAVKTRIPYKRDQHIWISKSKVKEIHGGRTLLTSIQKNKEYKIYSAENKVTGTINGNLLYKNSYAPVEKAKPSTKLPKPQNQIPKKQHR